MCRDIVQSPQEIHKLINRSGKNFKKMGVGGQHLFGITIFRVKNLFNKCFGTKNVRAKTLRCQKNFVIHFFGGQTFLGKQIWRQTFLGEYRYLGVIIFWENTLLGCVRYGKVRAALGIRNIQLLNSLSIQIKLKMFYFLTVNQFK